jgi:tRNA/tmRNA/rRNA uracil-C5-methylase (TrmA/RlmC/RlmD family)
MEESLAMKERWLRERLHRYEDKIMPICSVDESARWGYRRKIQLNARYENNRWHFGMIRRKEFIAIPDCPVHSEKTRRLIHVLISVLPPFDLFPLAYLYQSDSLVTLVLKTKELPATNWMTEDIINVLKINGIRGFAIHLNPSAGRRMFAKSGWNLLWGNNRAVNDYGLVYGFTSFSQLIPRLHNQSLDEAENFLNPAEDDCVIDLYCGIGTSLIRWLRRCAATIGVENGGEAVECAGINAPDAMVLRGACRQRLPQLLQWVREKFKTGQQKLVYVNPPRTGIESEVLDWIVNQLIPHKIAYLSCSAGTLNRDLKVLTDNNFLIEKITPYDFFPQTHHVECLVLLKRKAI